MVEVSATSWSLVQRSPTDCGASLCVIKKPRERGHSPRWAAVPDKLITIIIIIFMFIYSYCYICNILCIVLLCCSVYCLGVNMYRTTATGCQTNGSKYINSNKSTFNCISLVAVNIVCNKIFTADVRIWTKDLKWNILKNKPFGALAMERFKKMDPIIFAAISDGINKVLNI
jgi:hypothetical protein